MSIMDDLANEALKPVKTGLFIGTAVLTVGGLAIAANSQTGRSFLGKVSNAVKGVPNKPKTETNNKQIDKTSQTTPVETGNDNDVNMIDDDDVHVIDNNEQKSNVKGSNNV